MGISFFAGSPVKSRFVIFNGEFHNLLIYIDSPVKIQIANRANAVVICAKRRLSRSCWTKGW